MKEVRHSQFPYGMQKNSDGTWTLFNRDYKPVGVIGEAWEEWDTARHKLKRLTAPARAKLDIEGKGTGDRIYFYADGSVPTRSKANMANYLAKLAMLMAVRVE